MREPLQMFFLILANERDAPECRLCRTYRVKDVLPLPQTDLAFGLSDRYAKRRIVVKDGDADLDFRDLPFEVPRHERLA